MRISDIARRSGASQKAIRLYEARGLLAPVPRVNRYRDYGEKVVGTIFQVLVEEGSSRYRSLLSQPGRPTRSLQQESPETGTL